MSICRRRGAAARQSDKSVIRTTTMTRVDFPFLCRKALAFGFRGCVRSRFLGLVKAWPRNREVGAHGLQRRARINAIRSFVCTRAHRRRGHTRATRKGQGGRAHRGAAMATPMVGDDANAARARATPEPTTDTHRGTKTNIRNRQRFETRVTDAVWSVRAHVLSRARVTSRGVTAFQQTTPTFHPSCYPENVFLHHA